MVIQFSDEIIKAMGFTKFPEGRKIGGHFYIADIFAIEGFILPENMNCEIVCGKIDGVTFKICAGPKINKIFNAIEGGDYIKDEKSWEAEKGTQGPFVAIVIGPSSMYEAEAHFLQVVDGVTLAYDCFREAEEELNQQRDIALPKLVAGFSCSLATDSQYFRFRSIDKCTYGKTEENETIKGFRITGSATGFLSVKTDEQQARNIILRSIEIAQLVHPRAAKFHHLGFEEKDDMKKFLYYFMSIEIAIHKKFGEIQIKENLEMMPLAPSRLRTSVPGLFNPKRERWTRVTDRLVWCSVFDWIHIKDADIDGFRKIKGIRDQLAHGAISAPDPHAVQSVQDFAKRLYIPLPSPLHLT